MEIHWGWLLFLAGVIMKLITIYIGEEGSQKKYSITVRRSVAAVSFLADVFSIVGFLFALLDPRLGRMEELLKEIRNLLRGYS